ncbi:hypothetical protein EKH55_1022 [Sinorhizobium alkalisoli]|nr:hypothetical protein EKH55_1022 [Sinorhizobium alkalisoli]
MTHGEGDERPKMTWGRGFRMFAVAAERAEVGEALDPD